MQDKSLNIAVVGSGIAGLSVAWLLGQKHNVTLYERHDAPGMGAFNLNYREGALHESALGDSQIEARIDVPIRAFNRSYYKNLAAFYQEMGVEFLRTDHSATYTVAKDFSDSGDSYFGYRYVKLGNRALPIFAGLSKVNLKSLLIAKEASRFLWRARRDTHDPQFDQISIEDYLGRGYFADWFVEDVIYPSFAAICTCSYEAIKQYPARIIIEFLASGMLFDGIWRAKFGADDPIARMLSATQEIRCNTAVSAVVEDESGVLVKEENGRESHYDHVVIATQANQAAQLLVDETDHTDEARQLLLKVPYEKSEVVVHGDRSLVPTRLEDQAPVNFLVDKDQDAPMASICLNDLYPSLQGAKPLYQTWNPLMRPAPDKIVGQAYFERPIVNVESLQAIKRLDDLQQNQSRTVWFVGSYAKPGIPLLESAVQSAMTVAKRLSCEAPWV